MGAIQEGYITATEASGILGKGINLVAKLCQAGKLPGAEKIGNAWLIPRESVESYTPDRRGPKPKKERLAAELATIRAELAETAKEELTA